MEYNLKLTWEDVNMIWSVLQKQPYEMVVKLIASIQKQVNEQNTPIKEETKEKID